MARLPQIGRILGNRSLVIGVAIVGAVALVALLAGTLYPGDPRDMVGRPNIWPGSDPRYPLGTDMLGRDIAAGMAHAARASLAIGFLTTLAALVIGMTVGIVSGYCGRRIDDGLMRFTELFQTIPNFLLAVMIIIAAGTSALSIGFALAVTSWPQIARLMRAEVMRVRQMDYVQAATGIGLSTPRVILQHILPNSIAPVVVTASIVIAEVILADASLAFLGLGDPNAMSWGRMVGESQSVVRTTWYMSALPGLAILVTVLGLTFIGRGLGQALNPRQARRLSLLGASRR